MTVIGVVLLLRVSVKVTRPEGVPAPGGVTLRVAVNKTDWPTLDGFGLEARVIFVSACITFCTRLGDTLPAKLLSPP